MNPNETPPSGPIRPADFTPLGNAAAPAPRRAWPLWLALATGLALPAAALVFLFGAYSLEVRVEAQAAVDTSISGLALPFGQRYLLWPGRYRLRAEAPGYRPETVDVVVEARDGQRVDLALQPLPGLVSIATRPAGARVSIDGEVVGQTPLEELELTAGEHLLRIEESRHLPLDQTIEVTGRGVRQSLAFDLEPAWAELRIDSAPSGAALLVDGERLGRTPASIEVLAGERQLILQAPGFADWQRQLDVEAGQDLDLGTVPLDPAPGELALSSEPAGANVTLDGEFQGQTPLTLALTPDRAHRLAVFKPGYRRFTDSVSLPAAARAERSVRLEAQLGEVRLRIVPEDAVVKVNGRTVGTGGRTLTLPAVEHSLEISLDGYRTERRRITPRPGLPQLVEIELLTQAQARMAAVPPEITTPLGQTLRLFRPEDSPLRDFTMGASRREPGRRANEVLHPVGLRRMFYLQTTEVTNGQFRQFQAAHNSGQVSGTSLNRDRQPAVQVSWQQAAAFCNWLSRREGLPPFYREREGIITGFDATATGYRLPTEAEWSFAARVDGDRLRRFPWGDTFPPDAPVENYADNTSAHVTGRVLNHYADGEVVSAEVGSFRPNQNGLYDIGGNVSEWVHDVYGIPAEGGETAIDPLGKASGDNHVIRGASWARARLGELRLTYRDYGQAGRDDVGFRLARYAE